MRVSIFPGVRARAKRTVGAAAVAGAAGLSLSPTLASAQALASAETLATAQTLAASNTVEGVDVLGAPQRIESPRFTAPLQDTPRSVTVIPQQIIQQTAAYTLQDLLRTSAPGVTFGAGEGGQPLADRPFIRGQSSGNNIFVDNLRDTGGQLREVFNLEQVEVLKGPDSAYNGRGSGGGSINLSTKKPKVGNFLNVGAGAGSSSFLRGTVDANYQLNDVAAVRLNVMGTKGDVPGRGEAVDFKRWGFAPSIAYGLGAKTRATASYYHYQADDMPDYGVPLSRKLPGQPRTESGILPVKRDSFYGLVDRDFIKNIADVGTLSLEHDLTDDISIRNVFRYGRTVNDYVVTNPGDGGNAEFVGGEWWMKRGTKSRRNVAKTTGNITELYGKFTTGAIEHSFSTGAEFYREKNDNASYTITTIQGSPCPAGFSSPGTGDCTRVFDPNPFDRWAGTRVLGPFSEAKANTTGLYAFDTLKLTEQWQVNVGGRWDKYTARGVNATVSGGTVTYNPVGKTSWDFFNYQVGLVYKPVPNGTVYVSYGTASTPPTIASGDQLTASGTGTGSLANVVLDPEDSDSWEGGVKWGVLDNQLQLSAAVFRTVRKNAVIQLDANTVAQAGETKVQGLELSFNGRITRRWQVNGGYTYMDSELVRGPYNSINIGDQLANTPKHSFSVFTTYRVIDKLSVGGGAYHVGKTYGGNQNSAGGGNNLIYMPSYWRFDAFAAYDLSDHVSLQLNVQNLGDKEYFVRTNGNHHADFGAARQAILTLNLRY